MFLKGRYALSHWLHSQVAMLLSHCDSQANVVMQWLSYLRWQNAVEELAFLFASALVPDLFHNILMSVKERRTYGYIADQAKENANKVETTIVKYFCYIILGSENSLIIFHEYVVNHEVCYGRRTTHYSRTNYVGYGEVQVDHVQAIHVVGKRDVPVVDFIVVSDYG